MSGLISLEEYKNRTFGKKKKKIESESEEEEEEVEEEGEQVEEEMDSEEDQNDDELKEDYCETCGSVFVKKIRKKWDNNTPQLTLDNFKSLMQGGSQSSLGEDIKVCKSCGYMAKKTSKGMKINPDELKMLLTQVKPPNKKRGRPKK
jgi:ribosomal protein L37E